MHLLQLLYRNTVRLVQRAAALCRTAAMVVPLWRRQQAMDALEAERLDRIRNPSKYLGKS